MPPLAHYKLNGDANDVSGNGLDGTATNVTYPVGKIGQAASFNGTTSFVDTGITDIGSGNEPYSVSAWLNPNFQPAAGYDRIITKSNTCGAADSEFVLQQNGADNKVVAQLSNTSNTRFYAGGDISPNVWSHVVVVFSGTQIILYINGVAVKTTDMTGTLRRVATAIIFGRRGDGHADYFYNGLMDDVRIYDEALSAWKIEAICNGGKGSEERQPWQRLIQPAIQPIIRPSMGV